jgi:hypothetical protein
VSYIIELLSDNSVVVFNKDKVEANQIKKESDEDESLQSGVGPIHRKFLTNRRGGFSYGFFVLFVKKLVTKNTKKRNCS